MIVLFLQQYRRMSQQPLFEWRYMQRHGEWYYVRVRTIVNWHPLRAWCR